MRPRVCLRLFETGPGRPVELKIARATAGVAADIAGSAVDALRELLLALGAREVEVAIGDTHGLGLSGGCGQRQTGGGERCEKRFHGSISRSAASPDQ